MDHGRRKIVGGLSLLGVNLLAGCITPGGGLRRDGTGTEATADEYRSIYYSDASGASTVEAFEFFDPRKSAMAKRIFDTVRERKIISQAVPMPSEAQVDKALGALRQAQERHQGKRELQLDDGFDIAQSLVPLMRMYLDLSAPEAEPGKATKETPKLSKDGTLTIPPGYKVTTIQKGYCLDKNLGAPGAGEVLTLMPAEQLIPQELLPLYRAMQLKAFQDDSYRDKMQNLMWTLRSAGEPNSLASGVTPQTLREMEQAMPGGARAFADYHNSHFGQAASRAAAGGAGKPPPEYSILGLLNTITGHGDRNAKSPGASELFAAFVDGMNNRPVTGSHPTDNRNYQMLAPGIATWSIGAGPLKPQIEIVNTGNRPFDINYANWIAKPARQAQQVAMYPNTPANTFYEQYPRVADPEQAAARNTLAMRVLKDGLEPAGRFLTDRALKNFSQSDLFKNLATRLLKSNPAVKVLIDTLPGLGNVLSLYEAVTGKNWLTGMPLNAFERVASCLGVIPLAGYFKVAMGAGAIKTAGMAFAGAGVATNLGVTDPIFSYAKEYKDPVEFAGKYVSDGLNGNLNKGLEGMLTSSKLSAADKKNIEQYLTSQSYKTGYSYSRY